MKRCKICDVRDYATARLCADLGADYLGLHCINELKNERKDGLLKIATEIPKEFSKVGVVVVTLLTEPQAILAILHTLRPTHVQLHSRKWNGSSIRAFKRELCSNGLEDIKTIAVLGITTATRERIVDVGLAADLLLFDRKHYDDEDELASVPTMEHYREAVLHAEAISVPAFIAGKLDPDNVGAYLESVSPWGVDVQTGVAYSKEDPRKDPERLRLFIGLVKGRLPLHAFGNGT